MAWHCHTCDRPVPNGQPVPLCPVCGLMPLDERGREPSPKRCSGPGHHPLGPDRMTVGWQPCMCPTGRRNKNGHRWWRCNECGDVITAPPCEGQDDGRPHGHEEAPPTP